MRLLVDGIGPIVSFAGTGHDIGGKPEYGDAQVLGAGHRGKYGEGVGGTLVAGSGRYPARPWTPRQLGGVKA